MGALTERSQSGMIDAAAVNALMAGVNVSATLPGARGRVLSAASDMDTYTRGMYLGFGDTLQLAGGELGSLLTLQSFSASYFFYSSAAPGGGLVVNQNSSAWEILRAYVGKLRMIGYNATLQPGVDIAPARSHNQTADFFFVNVNGPAVVYDVLTSAQLADMQAATDTVNACIRAQLIVLLVTISVFAAAIVYFHLLLDRVAAARINLFSVFLIIPRPAVIKLATKSTRLAQDEEEEEEEEEEDDWAQRQARARRRRRTAARLRCSGALVDAVALARLAHFCVRAGSRGGPGR